MYANTCFILSYPMHHVSIGYFMFVKNTVEILTVILLQSNSMYFNLAIVINKYYVKTCNNNIAKRFLIKGNSALNGNEKGIKTTKTKKSLEIKTKRRRD